MIAFAQIDIGTGDVLRCAACARSAPAPAEPAPFDRVRDAVKDAVASWDSGPGPNVALTGFEPFAHPDLPEIIRVAGDMGCRRIRLRTDGGAFSIPGNAAGAIGAGVRQIELVILADGDAHDELSGRQGLFAAVSSGVREYSEAARAAEVPFVLTGLVRMCRHNSMHVPAAVARLAEFGAVAVDVDASEMRAADEHHLVAALDTAAANAMAGSVSGQVREMALPWNRRPWSIAEARR